MISFKWAELSAHTVLHDINIIGDEDGGRQIAEIGNRYVAIHSRSLYPQSLKIEVFVKYLV